MTVDNPNLVTDNRDYLIKQSEMLQAIIARMAGNSLTVKQLGFTTWTALVGFGFTNKTPSLFVLALIALVFMGFLDMYYLLLERRFRTSFNRLVELLCGFNEQALDRMQQVKGNFVKPESLGRKQAFEMYLGTLKSWANLPYLIIISITVVILSLPS